MSNWSYPFILTTVTVPDEEKENMMLLPSCFTDKLSIMFKNFYLQALTNGVCLGKHADRLGLFSSLVDIPDAPCCWSQVYPNLGVGSVVPVFPLVDDDLHGVLWWPSSNPFGQWFPVHALCKIFADHGFNSQKKPWICLKNPTHLYLGLIRITSLTTSASF